MKIKLMLNGHMYKIAFAIGIAICNANSSALAVSVNLKDYISSGAGTEMDPYFSVNGAMTAAQAALPEAGGVIVVPPGYYKNTGEIRITKSNISLQGDGIGTTFFLKKATSSQRLLVILSANNCTISNITFDGGRLTQPTPWGALCLSVLGSSNVLIDRCKFQQTNGAAIYVERNFSDLMVQYCEFFDNDRSLWQLNGENYRNITVRNNRFHGNQTAIISLDNPQKITGTSYSNNVIIENNWFESWRQGVAFTGCTGIQIKNNTFSGAPLDVSYNQCIHLEHYTRDVLVEGNNLQVDGGAQGMTLQWVENVEIRNNMIRVDNGDGIDSMNSANIDIKNNFFKGTNVGVDSWVGSVNTDVKDNWFITTGSRDVVLTGVGSTNSITNNVSQGALSLKNVSENTQVTGNLTYDQYVTQYGSPPTAWGPIVDPLPWDSTDIGSVGLLGSAAYLGGSYTLAGAGSISGTTDSFQYMSRTLTGDGAIVARVVSQENTATPAKAGVMIRQTLEADSPFAAMYTTNGAGVLLGWRAASGGTYSSSAITGLAAPYWVKVAREGDVFTGYRSTDGVVWNQTGPSQTLAMGNRVHVGLAVCSGNNLALNTSMFDSVSVVPGTEWSSRDIGPPSVSGFTEFNYGELTVNAGGTDIFGTSDQFRYVYRSANGDCSITARVTAVQDTHIAAKAGVMIRETLGAGSPHVSVCAKPATGISFYRRNIVGGNSSIITANAALTGPYWLRVTRVGNTFTGYASPDGVTWTLMGTTTVTMGSSVYIGIPATSHVGYLLGGATVNNISAVP